MKSLKLKRVEVSDLFKRVNSFFTKNELCKSTKINQQYFIIKRMHACVRIEFSSIMFFYNHIYRVNTYRTKIYFALLIGACYSKFLKNLLFKLNLVDSIEVLPSYYHTAWNTVDVLYAEWDFITIFSASKNEVVHLLNDSKYLTKLFNEVEARRELHSIINIPSLKSYNLNNNGFWIDSLAVSRNGQYIFDIDFENAQEQIIKAYENTKKFQELRLYLSNIYIKSKNVYAGEFLSYITNLYNFILSNCNHELLDSKLRIVRCHGDFNRGQILKNKNEVFIIDWAESEENFILHDVVYNFLMSENSININWDVIRRSYSVLYSYVTKEVNKFANSELISAIVLIEVANKQFAAYNENKGNKLQWVKLYKQYKFET